MMGWGEMTCIVENENGNIVPWFSFFLPSKYYQRPHLVRSQLIPQIRIARRGPLDGHYWLTVCCQNYDHVLPYFGSFFASSSLSYSAAVSSVSLRCHAMPKHLSFAPLDRAGPDKTAVYTHIIKCNYYATQAFL